MFIVNTISKGHLSRSGIYAFGSIWHCRAMMRHMWKSHTLKAASNNWLPSARKAKYLMAACIFGTDTFATFKFGSGKLKFSALFALLLLSPSQIFLLLLSILLSLIVLTLLCCSVVVAYSLMQRRASTSKGGRCLAKVHKIGLIIEDELSVCSFGNNSFLKASQIAFTFPFSNFSIRHENRSQST